MEVGVARKLSISMFYERRFYVIFRGGGRKETRKREKKGRRMICLISSSEPTSPVIIRSLKLNYSVKLSRLMEYFLLMTNKCDAHVGELLSGESCDLKVQLKIMLHFVSGEFESLPVEQSLTRNP